MGIILEVKQNKVFRPKEVLGKSSCRQARGPSPSTQPLPIPILACFSFQERKRDSKLGLYRLSMFFDFFFFLTTTLKFPCISFLSSGSPSGVRVVFFILPPSKWLLQGDPTTLQMCPMGLGALRLPQWLVALR